MSVSVSLAEAQRSVKQALTNLALLSLTGAVSTDDAAVILRLLSGAAALGDPSDGGLTLSTEQIKMRGMGRRPASLLGREVVVTATWQVVREFEDGRVTVTLADSPTVKRARKTARKKRAQAM